jgi:hypothetical protein
MDFYMLHPILECIGTRANENTELYTSCVLINIFLLEGGHIHLQTIDKILELPRRLSKVYHPAVTQLAQSPLIRRAACT